MLGGGGRSARPFLSVGGRGTSVRRSVGQPVKAAPCAGQPCAGHLPQTHKTGCTRPKTGPRLCGIRTFVPCVLGRLWGAARLLAADLRAGSGAARLLAADLRAGSGAAVPARRFRRGGSGAPPNGSKRLRTTQTA